MKKGKTGGLGRGLGAFGLGSAALPAGEKSAPAAASVRAAPTEVPVDAIAPNRFQPRREFDEGALEELRDSIARYGILQPLVVRDLGTGRYELIAGERRLRAAKLACLTAVPVIFRTANDAELAEMALIENLQREDLGPMEEARAYERLLEEFGLSQEQLAQRVARSRSYIANMVRLLRLAPEVQDLLASGVLTVGQARPLLALPSHLLQSEAAVHIQERELSARAAEALVHRLLKDPHAIDRAPSGKERARPDIFLRSAEERLTQSLGTKVCIRQGRTQGKGKLEISYFSADDLERLLALLTSADPAAGGTHRTQETAHTLTV